MKHFFIILLSSLLTTLSYGQTFQRLENETAAQFAERIKPENAEVAHNVIQATWNQKPSLLIFYNQTYKLSKEQDPDQQDYQLILATLLVEENSGQYEKYVIDTLKSEGGDPVIESVFFANADKDPGKELILLVSWEQQHYDVSGTLYSTFVYDNLSGSKTKELSFLKNISNVLDGGCECSWRDGEQRKAKFKTPAEVRAELKRLGFKS